MTVGEGIERPREHALLVDLGCDLGQGFLLGRPLNAVHTTELLTAAVAHFDVFGRLAASGPRTPAELRADLGLAERPAVVLLTVVGLAAVNEALVTVRVLSVAFSS